MPTYEYACTNCGHRFDVRQRFSDDPITDCPQCGASVRRVLYPAGVIFKGSGWYATDNRRGSASHTSSTTTSSDSSTSSSTEKPAAEAKSDATPKDTKVKTAAADD